MAVLESRAIEIANAVSATARLNPAPPSPERAKEILKAHAGASDVGISLFRLDGERLAAEPLDEPTQVPADVVGVLRLQGQMKRVRGAYLEYWRILGPGRRLRGAWGRQFRGRPPSHGQRPHPDAHRPWGPRRHRMRLVRVRVARSASAPLLRSATTTLALSAATGALLITLGVVLFFIARRAGRNEALLREREALAELGELGAVLAHEVRTPLASIKGNAQLICEDAHEEDARCGTIIRETERLERLVNGLLDYARPAPLALRPVELLPLLERSVEIVAPVAERHQVAVLVDPPEERLWVDGGVDSLIQVFVNLLQNAIEATAAAEGTEALVTVTLRGVRGRVELRIVDRGVGLNGPQEEAFRPFFTTKAEGTGLGLSVSRQILMQHGGSLQLLRREGGGTIAELVLPLRSG
ncbi:MAG: GHKL domain-containing protein [Deltaproteobacteria bacterium]|nr:GHKL domain-containing protein [Deltaproteobacteria bacterium]